MVGMGRVQPVVRNTLALPAWPGEQPYRQHGLRTPVPAQVAVSSKIKHKQKVWDFT